MDKNTATGRATETWQKRILIEALFAAWVANPELRLGQLIVNAVTGARDVFSVEDMELSDLLRAYVSR